MKGPATFLISTLLLMSCKNDVPKPRPPRHVPLKCEIEEIDETGPSSQMPLVFADEKGIAHGRWRVTGGGGVPPYKVRFEPKELGIEAQESDSRPKGSLPMDFELHFPIAAVKRPDLKFKVIVTDSTESSDSNPDSNHVCERTHTVQLVPFGANRANGRSGGNSADPNARPVPPASETLAKPLDTQQTPTAEAVVPPQPTAEGTPATKTDSEEDTGPVVHDEND